MNLNLSWDLFAAVFLVVIVAYSFIIGKDRTLKVILGSYIGAITADAFGGFVQKLLSNSESLSDMAESGGFGGQETIVFLKVILFVVLVILFTSIARVEVDTEDNSRAVDLGWTTAYALLSGVLIVSIILVFVSGEPFLTGLAVEDSSTIWNLSVQSKFIRIFLDYAHFWFFLPALVFVINSIIDGKKS